MLLCEKLFVYGQLLICSNLCLSSFLRLISCNCSFWSVNLNPTYCLALWYFSAYAWCKVYFRTCICFSTIQCVATTIFIIFIWLTVSLLSMVKRTWFWLNIRFLIFFSWFIKFLHTSFLWQWLSLFVILFGIGSVISKVRSLKRHQSLLSHSFSFSCISYQFNDVFSKSFIALFSICFKRFNGIVFLSNLIFFIYLLLF